MLPAHFSHPEIEPMPGIRERAFLFKTFRKPRFDFIWHLHPEFELTHIRHGSGVRYIGSSIRPFYGGDLCLLGGNLPHAYGTHPRQTGLCSWQVIHFLPDAWGQAFWQLSENRKIVSLLRASRRGLRFPAAQLSRVKNRLAGLESLPPASGQRIPLFLEILQMLATVRNPEVLNAGPLIAESGNIDPRISKVLRWLEDHVATGLSQPEAAAVIGMPSASFSRFFQQKTGRLFNRHVNEIRVAHACASLTTTEKSVAEIAFEAGFANLSNFNRRFVELVGMTPREYRGLQD